jgi:hypothetical protein
MSYEYKSTRILFETKVLKSTSTFVNLNIPPDIPTHVVLGTILFYIIFELQNL